MAPRSTREQLRAAIKAQGLRVTPSRVAVLTLLQASAKALSHADVVEKLRRQHFDRATLFRNLVDLAEAGLLRRSDRGDHIWRFEHAAATHSATSHPHFQCTSCGDVTCLPVMQFASRNAPKSLRIQQAEIHVRGLCDGCDRESSL